MLDLDSLAQQRAKSVNEGEDTWRAAVWSAEFQKLSQSMSDGEVEALLAYCHSAQHFLSAVRHLERRAGATGLTPFAALKQDAEQAGVSPAEWIKSQLP